MKNLKFKNVKVNGKIIPTYTIGQLASMCNRERVTMLKMEERNLLPPPNLRGRRRVKKNGDTVLGERKYSVDLCNKIVKILAGVKQGVAITNEQRRRLLLAFQEEKMFIEEQPEQSKP